MIISDVQKKIARKLLLLEAKRECAKPMRKKYKYTTFDGVDNKVYVSATMFYYDIKLNMDSMANVYFLFNIDTNEKI